MFCLSILKGSLFSLMKALVDNERDTLGERLHADDAEVSAVTEH
jgi:hypothetical protein